MVVHALQVTRNTKYREDETSSYRKI